MRKLLYLALLFAGPLFAQTNQPTFQYVNVIPSGTCTGTPPIQVLYLTGQAYSCNNGTWGPFAGGTGGGTPTGPAGGVLTGFYPNPSGIAASYWASLTGCAVAGNVYSPQSNSCIIAGGIPAGPNNSVQLNQGGVFAGDSSLTFDPTTKALAIGPIGTVAGSNSGPLLFQSLYNTGSGLALQTFDFHVQIGSGVMPFSQLVIDGPGCPGGCEVLDLLAFHFANDVEVQSGASLRLADAAINSSVCTDAFSHLVTSGCSGGGGGGLTPAQFGAHGDGLIIGNGCTTNGTTSVVCAGASFISGDVGKLLCVAGAGAGGIGFCSVISSVTNSTTAVVSATPSTNVTSAQSSYGHDDVVALQDCLNASAANNTPCVLSVPINFNTPNGYLIQSAGLLIPTKTNIQGSADNDGTTIISEFDGDAFSMPTSTASLQAGQPIEAVTMANFSVYHDPSWPNGRGFHINAAPGVFGFGGMFDSTISNVSDYNAAKECLWLDGHLNTDNNPNQYITFNKLRCNGPNQSHPANEIKITGIQAQIIFMNGSIDGTSNSFYPNPLIYVGEKTSGQGDSPAAVSFFGFTYEVGTQGLYIGNGSTNIHFDNGYVEAVETPLIVEGAVSQFTYRGNHVANSGNVTAVADFIGHVSEPISGTIQDTLVYGSVPPAAFAVCSGGTNNFTIDFLNNKSTATSSANCATSHSGTGAALFQAAGTSVTVDPSATVITTILDPDVQPGKTLTMIALSGGGGAFSLGTGGTLSGNAYPISLGAFSSPLAIATGNSVTLALFDQSGSPVWTVVGGTDLPAAILASSETVASSANPIWSPAFATTYMVLGGNVTGPTLAAGADGQHKTLCFKQGAGSFTVASPANFKGFFTVGTVNGGLNCQGVVYLAPISFWVADGPGKTDQ